MIGESSLLDLAVELAHDAGRLLKKRFGSDVGGVSTKATPTDLVSDADREANALLVGAITTRRADDGVLSEEGGGVQSRSGLTWVVDPLDGTVNFLFGIPVWAVSIAVCEGPNTLVGVVHDPMLGETFTAQRGNGAGLNGRPIHVTEAEDLSQSLVATGFAYDARARRVQAELLPDVLPRIRDIRRAGSAALDLAWVAAGRLDGFFESTMKRWDRAAGELLVREAGGRLGELPAPYSDDSGVVAAGSRLFGDLYDLVREAN